MKNSHIAYDYFVHPITEDDDSPAYKAVIPAFDNAVVYGENLKELEEGIAFCIEEEMLERKKKKLPIPKPERSSKFNGKILVRISPLLHEKIFLQAKASGKSLSKYIEEQLH